MLYVYYYSHSVSTPFTSYLTDRQMDKTDWRTDRQIDKTDWRTDRQIDKTDGQTDRQNGLTDGQTDRQNGLTDGQTDRQSVCPMLKVLILFFFNTSLIFSCFNMLGICPTIYVYVCPFFWEDVRTSGEYLTCRHRCFCVNEQFWVYFELLLVHL